MLGVVPAIAPISETLPGRFHDICEEYLRTSQLSEEERDVLRERVRELRSRLSESLEPADIQPDALRETADLLEQEVADLERAANGSAERILILRAEAARKVQRATDASQESTQRLLANSRPAEPVVDEEELRRLAATASSKFEDGINRAHRACSALATAIPHSLDKAKRVLATLNDELAHVPSEGEALVANALGSENVKPATGSGESLSLAAIIKEKRLRL